MKKGREVEKKARSRNLKGLSIFDEEIAAPADYGDFMKIDAPVALRTATPETKVVQEVASAPHWEKFIGNDGTPTVVEAKVEPRAPEIKAAEVESTPRLESNNEISHSNESTDEEAALKESPQPVVETPQQQALNAAHKTEQEKAVPAETINIQSETAHKLPTPQVRKVESESPKVILPRPVPSRVELKSTDYEKITLSYGFGSLVGVQRRIVIFIFEDCVRGGKSETTPLTTEHLCQTLGLTYKTTRGSVWRLQQKGFLEVAASKEGRGGWVIYRLNRDIYSELLLLKNSNQLLERDIGIGSIPQEAQAISAPRVEPVVAEEDKELAKEWQAIDFSALADIGFTKYHLKQLEIQKKNKLTPEEVQDSINFFAFDLKKNNKKAEIKGEPLHYFMGIVRNGNPYTPPTNYRSAEDEQRLQYLNYLKRKETERIEEEKKIKDLEFQNWKATADLTEILKAAPEYVRGKTGPLMDAYLDGHFVDHVWPSIMSKFASNGEERAQIAQEIRQSLGSPS